LGETLFEARARAIAAASLVKSPSGGCVESLVTLATQYFPEARWDRPFIADFFRAEVLAATEAPSGLRSRFDALCLPGVGSLSQTGTG
jgi:hypothetical protein